jgi:hypothetical protein
MAPMFSTAAEFAPDGIARIILLSLGESAETRYNQ